MLVTKELAKNMINNILIIFNSKTIFTFISGGTNMRGDQKWPPQDYRQSHVDNETRRQIALGPVFRPRRVEKVNFFSNPNNFY